MKITHIFVALCLLVCQVTGAKDSNSNSIVAVPSNINDEDSNKGSSPGPVTQSFLDEIENKEVFEPTSEWQNLKPGQAIPAGLHVQMNLQTGEKKAKLMDGDDGSKYKNHAKTKYYTQNNHKEKYVNIDRNVFTKQHLKDVLKDFKDKFHDEKLENNEAEKLKTSKKFRSIEEIRKELDGVNIFMKNDIEIIKEHVKVLNMSSSTIEQKEHALDELEFYVHQIDNAGDFNTIGGLALVIKLLNSTEQGLCSKAAYVLGSASQSNPTIQKAAQRSGTLPILLRLLGPQQPMAVRRKAMYALSSLTRLFSKGQQEFMRLNGLEIFINLFNEKGAGPLRVKALTLMTDILTEQFDFVKNKAEKQGAKDMEAVIKQVPLLQAMMQQGWCKLVPSLLNTSENDTKEKVLQALHVMVVGCKNELKETAIYDNLDKLRKEWTTIAKTLDSDEAEYLMTLSQLATDLISKLN